MQLFQDLRFAIRSCRQRVAFTAILVVALALGIGLTTSIFTVFYSVLLKPLALREPERLLVVQERMPKLVPVPINMPAHDTLAFGGTSVFSGTAAFVSAERNLALGDSVERVDGLRASYNLLPLLGVSPVLGRNFSADEDLKSGHVALVSESLAHRRFAGGNPVGQKILLNDQPYQIIGVLPHGFAFPYHGMYQTENAEIWIPLSLTADERKTIADNFDYSLIARLKDGVSLHQAEAAMGHVLQALAKELPPDIKAQLDMQIVLQPMKELVVGGSRKLLLLLLGSVGALLLISCLNVSNMLLSRALARRREFAVRAAVGAGSGRLIRQMLHENLVLFLAGGLLGALCAMWSQSLLVRLLPPDLPRATDIQMDGSVLGFTIALSIITGLLFGLLPATGSLKADLITPLREGSRGQSQGVAANRMRRFLVVTQLVLAFVLLTSAGLLLRSFLTVLDEQSGARSTHAVTFGVPAPDTRYPDGKAMGRLYTKISERITRLPNVQAVGFGSDIPFESHWRRLITPDGATTSAKPVVNSTEVAGDYFQALGLRLIAGRRFDAHDRKGSQPVVIVNEAFVRTFWPGQNAIGHTIKFGGAPEEKQASTPVIGIVSDTREYAPDEPATPHIYIPADQNVYGVLGGQAWFVVSTTADAGSLSNLIRAEVRSVDSSLPVVKLRTMGEVFSTAVAPRRANTWLVTVFALTALLLTALGVYGVVAQSVAERTREIGIRMALGAEHRQVLRSVLWDGGKMAIIGLVVGVAASFAVSRLIQSLLYSVSTTDITATAGSAVALAMATLCAVALPAWRATKVDPQVALRDE